MKRDFPLYNMLSLRHQELYDRCVRTQKFERGDTIHSHSGSCLGILRVMSGIVNINMTSYEGREVTLFRLRAGEYFVLSAVCILKNVGFDANIEAETDCEVEILPSHALSVIISEDKTAECEMYKITANRFSDILVKLQRVMFRSVDSRIAEFLVDECSEGDTTIYLTHEQLAKFIGSSREVITRVLKRMSDMGLIAQGRGTIKIVNKAELSALI